MKDPLSPLQAPWEVLGIDSGADQRTVEAAFMQALRNRTSTSKAKWARDTMLAPVNREVWRRATEYDPTVLQRLDPCPLNDPSVLEDVSRRLSVADVWEEQLRQSFPDFGIVHALAVFWLSWVLYEEDRFAALLDVAPQGGSVTADATKKSLLRQARAADDVRCDRSRPERCVQVDCRRYSDCHSSAPPLPSMWERLIGCWGVLAAAEEFWGNAGLDSPEPAEPRNAFVEWLQQRLADLALKYGGRLGGDSAQKKLGDTLGVGKAAVRALESAGLDSPHDVLCAGVKRLILIGAGRDGSVNGRTFGERQARGMFEASRAAVGRTLLPEQYRQLELALNGEVQTAQLMVGLGVKTNGSPMCCGPLMLQQLELLNDVRRQVRKTLDRTSDSKRLRVLNDALSPYRSVVSLLDSRRTKDALVALETLPKEDRTAEGGVELRARILHLLGKEQADVGEVEAALDWWEYALDRAAEERTKKIGDDVARSCLARAASLRHHQLDRAIALQERGLTLVSRKDLLLSLAEDLAERGVRTCNEAIAQAQRERRDVTREIKAGLEKGLADMERAGQLGSSRGAEQSQIAREVIADNMLGLSREITELLEMADRSAEQGDWDQAVSHVHRVYLKMGWRTPRGVKRKLAFCLNARGVANANRASKMLDQWYPSMFDRAVYGKWL